MATTKTFLTTGIAGSNQPPVAIVSPAEQTVIAGSIARVDGSGSYDLDGEVALYSWAFEEVPIGSALSEYEDLNSTETSFTFAPDVTGLYRVTLIVTDDKGADSPVAEAFVQVTATQAPVCTDLTPDASYVYKWISNFVGMVENKAVFEIVWSALIQIWGNELLKLMQIDYGKSIATIPDLFQRRWQHYDPLVSLDPSRTYAILGNQQDGIDATTGYVSRVVRGILLRNTEVRVMVGAVSADMVGQSLTILDSNGSPNTNNGVYTISGTLPSRRGYRLSGSTPLPHLAEDLITTGAPITDLVVTSGSSTVSSALTDFTAFTGFEAGDYLQIRTGAYKGLYRVMAVGSPTVNDLIVADLAPTSNETGIGADLYNTVTMNISSPQSPYTDGFYIKQTDGDLMDLNSGVLIGVGVIRGRSEFITGAAYVYDDASGKTITLAGAVNAGDFVIGGVNASRDGYIVTGSFDGVLPQEDVAFTIQEVGSAAGRVVLVNGVAGTLRQAFNSDFQADPPLGPGPASMGLLDSPILPTGQTGVEWRVPGTLVSSQFNFERIGVRAGDFLLGEVLRVDNGKVGLVGCSVVAVDGNRLGFEVTRQDIEPLGSVDLSPEEKVQLADALGVDGASLDLLGNLELEGDAEEVSDTYNSLAFARRYFNVPLRNSMLIDLGPFTVRIRAKFIIRNTAIRVHKDLRSVPCMSEYIAQPVTYTDDDGQVHLYTRDGDVSDLAITPFKLRENREYTVSGELAVSGTDGRATAGDGTFASASGDFVSRRVTAGDLLVIDDGSNAETYLITAVSSYELEVVEQDTGIVFPATDSSMRWHVERRVEGNFIHFVPDLFSPAYPAPSRLWSEASFYSNDKTIENNFGVLVGLKKEDLSDRGTRNVTYREAVRALMYSFSFGPRLQMVRVGAQILLGLPVCTETGIITEINTEYQTDPDTLLPMLGRILIDAVNPATGEQTGDIQVYFFTPFNTSVDDPDLTGIALNPRTGTEFVVGDEVLQYDPLSKGVRVNDYLSEPTWWESGAGPGGEKELRKYHTWQLEMSADQITPEDFLLAADFARAIRPVWTEPEAVLVKYLVDSIEMEDELLLEGEIVLAVNPGLGIEAVLEAGHQHHGVNLLDYSGRIKGTRILFAGDDLVTTAASSTVVSARGGFVMDVSPTMAPNAYFTQQLSVVPPVGMDNTDRMVRVGVEVPGETPSDIVAVYGDILYIKDGPNEGRYLISGVMDDSTLILSQLQDLGPRSLNPGVMLPYSPDPANMIAGVSQSFVIERVVSGNVAGNVGGTGLGVSIVGSVATLDYAAQAQSSGIAVGDHLFVIDNVGFPGGEESFEILEITDVPASTDVELTLDRAVGAPVVDEAWVVWRRILLPNPLLLAEVVAQSDWVALSEIAFLAFYDIRKYGVEPGDWLVPVTGAAVGSEWEIIDVEYGQVCLANAPAFGTIANGDQVSIVSRGSGGPTSAIGKILECIPRDLPEIELYAPKAAVAVGTDLACVGGTVVTSATFPNWAMVPYPPSVLDGLWVEIDPRTPAAVIAGADMATVAGSAVVSSPGSDFVAAAVVVGDYIAIAGVPYIIHDVLGVNDLELSRAYPATAGPLLFTVSRFPAPTVDGTYAVVGPPPAGPGLTVSSQLLPFVGHDFQLLCYIADFTLTSPGPFAYTDVASLTHNLFTLGAEPGDIVELWAAPGGFATRTAYRVLRVSAGGVITLTKNMGGVGTWYGRILRRRES